jgi:beta-aspartyl-peptidase (threonine type)
MVEFLGITIEDAAKRVINQELGTSDPDSGGLIAIGADGSISMPFNTIGMYRASAKGNATSVLENQVAIF